MAASYEGKIQARSPYYITATGAAYITSAEMEVFIWDGLYAAKPATATYTISKLAKTATETNIVFEISHLIRDYFEHAGDTYEGGTSVDCLWVEIALDVVQTTLPNDATVEYKYLAFDGYAEFSDGVNYEGTDAALTDMTGRKLATGLASNTNFLYIPVFCDATGSDTVKTYIGGVLDHTEDYTVAAASTDSGDKIQYLRDTINFLNVDEVRLYLGAVLVDTITINLIDDCDGDVTNLNEKGIRRLRFIDKNGMLQNLYMFKRTIDRMNVQHETYNSMIGEVVSNAYTYDVGKHVKTTLNTTGTITETINSGFVPEEMNEAFKQLMLSERVWVLDPQNSLLPSPITITSSSLESKYKKYDKLLNFTLEIEYANNVINEV